MNHLLGLTKPLLAKDAPMGPWWPMFAPRPIMDWRYFRHGELFGVAVQVGNVWRKISIGPGKLFLVEHPDEIPPVMRCFSIAKKGGRRHGRR